MQHGRGGGGIGGGQGRGGLGTSPKALTDDGAEPLFLRQACGAVCTPTEPEPAHPSELMPEATLTAAANRLRTLFPPSCSFLVPPHEDSAMSDEERRLPGSMQLRDLPTSSMAIAI